MSKFGYLQQYAVKPGKTVDYTLHQVVGGPTLKLAHAGETNKPYFNDAIRRNKKNKGALKLSAVALKKQRDEDREVFAKFVVKGWTGVLDVEGQEVPFSPEEAYEYLCALPDELFDEVRLFAREYDNFVDEVVSPEDLAGN